MQSEQLPRDCPVCGVRMVYAFPSRSSDPAVEALLWRFQKCRYPALPHVHTGEVFDVVAGVYHAVKLTGHGREIRIDGVVYENVAEWVKVHIIGRTKPRSE